MKQLRIENTKPVQEDFWGNGAIYHGYAGMPDDAGRVYTEEQCALEAKRATDMKLKIARTFYGWYAWDAEKKEWNWESERMQVFYRWLQRMKDGGITVALNTGWCSPGDINSSSWNGESPFHVPGDWEASLKNFGDWVSESLHQIVEVRGFTNVKIFVMFTEPQRYSGKPTIEGDTPYKLWRDGVRAAHEALVRDGRRHLIKLMGPNEGSTVTSDMVHWVAENADEYIDIYSSHSYQFTASVPYRYTKNGKGVVQASLAGGRICRSVTLKPDTDYTASITITFDHRVEKSEGNILFGVFKDIDKNDIYDNGKPLPGVTADSVAAIDPGTLGDDWKTVSLRFHTDASTTSGKIGCFYDVKTPGSAWIGSLLLTETGSAENLVENGDFSSFFDGWTMLFCGGTIDAYADWYKWCKTGLQYVPNGKPFCYDEYNVTFDRDNSRPSHGAEICTSALAFMNAGVQSSLLWTVFDQQWPNNHTYNADSFVDGDHRCGVMPVLNRSLVPHLSYYAFTLISKYVDGEGTKVYEGFGTNRIQTTMAVSKAGEITVIVVNCKEEADDFTISFEQPIQADFNRHVFDPATCVPDERAEIIGTDRVIENVTNTLSDHIAAYGVTVYTTMKD